MSASVRGVSPDKPRIVFTWRTLMREGGLKPGAAVEAMTQAVACAT